MKVVVIGAGVGGLSAAISCARAGHRVVVIEKNDCVGGKLWAHSARGFTFDCGPSILTLPAALKRVCGDAYRELTIRPLDEICHYFWGDGTEVVSHSSAELFAESIARGTGDSASRYLKYAARTEKLFARIAPLFLTQSIHSPSLLATKLFWQSLPRLPVRMSAVSMHAYNRQYFKNAKTLQIFDRFATYIGSSPYRTPAVYSLISYIEHGMGAYYVAQGMRAIPRVMRDVALKYGVRFCLNQRVVGIGPRAVLVGDVDGECVPDTDTVTSVDTATAAAEYAYDALISNADHLQTARLLREGMSARGRTPSRPRPPTPPRRLRYRPARRTTSAIVYLWGVDTRVDRFALHNILFSDDYRRECADIFTRFIVPTDPTIYINISSKKIEGDAPPGMENWFVMINVPASTAIDWTAAARRLRTRVTQKISRLCGIDIAAHITYERVMTPADFAQRSCDEYGSLYGKNAHGPLGALTRPANHPAHPMNRTARVYQCGGTAHPGGGVPLAILSGQIAAHQCCAQPPPSPHDYFV